MTNRISMQDIIELLASKNYILEEEADKFVLELFNIIEEGLTSDGLVKIKDFGTFKLTDIQERESIDVNTQEKIIIPAHRRVSFTPAQVLKSLVNKPFAHFETTPLNDGIVLENVKHDDAPENIDNEDEETIEKLNNIQDNDSVYEAPIATTDDIKEELAVVVEDNSISLNGDENTKSNNEEFSNAHSNDSLNKIDEPIDEPKDVITSSIKPPITKSKKKESKPKRSFLPWYIGTAVFIIFTLLFAYNFYHKGDTPDKKGV